MLTNEEIIERYGNNHKNNNYNDRYPEEYILCENCPLRCCLAVCDGYKGAYNRIREYLEKNPPDHDAGVAQEDKADVDILYICDRRACKVCDPNCRATMDIRHAKNFELKGRTMVEVEPKPPTYL